jgi:antitoxin CptB
MPSSTMPDGAASAQDGAAGTALDPRRKRVLFRAWHRGMKEMDLIFGRFADREIATLSEDELGALEALMEEPDDQVYLWVVGRTPVPATFDTPLFGRIRAYKHS